MTALEILKAARAKVAAGWTQGDFARDRLGEGRSALHPDATCFCSIGAIIAADRGTTAFSERAQAENLLEAVVGSRLARWNDAPGRTQAEVVAAFDKAIALAEGSK